MELFEDVTVAIEGSLAETGAPGAAVGLRHEGAERVAGFGITSFENPLEVTPDTLFQIGSITKTFTGTVVMALVERGELELDTPVRRYVPKLELADKDVAARVTMRHLLTHTAGWVGDYFADHGPGDDALERMVADLPRLPQLTPLGEVWSYNNAGFYLAGRVIEVVTREVYERVVRELLLEPLGLEQTLMFAEDVMTRRFAVGHHRNDSGPPTVARPWSIGRAHHAAGGLASSVRDLLRYARFHLSDGEGIVSRPSLDEMQRPSVRAESIFGWVGITWSVDDATGVRVISHGGGTNGQVSWLAILPDQATALAIVTNHQRGGEVIAAAKEVLLEAVGAASPSASPSCSIPSSTSARTAHRSPTSSSGATGTASSSWSATAAASRPRTRRRCPTHRPCLSRSTSRTSCSYPTARRRGRRRSSSAATTGASRGSASAGAS